MIIFIFISIILLSAFLVYASYSISSGVYVKAYCKTKIRKKEVAITFDDVPSGIETETILDLLLKHNVEASFFCIGGSI